MKLSPIVTSLASLLVACGGSDLDPGAGDDPGTGTSTLFVDGSVHAEARITNARETIDFETEVSIRIERDGLLVLDGVVTVTSASGSVPLTVREDRWEGRMPGYDEVYVVDVESGADNVRGVRIDGPDFHYFTAPAMGTTVDSTMPLLVQWDSGDRADITEIDVEEIDRLSIEDSGEYTLAPRSLKADGEQARANKIELRRTNRVVPAGAIAGSSLDVRVTNDVEVVAAPDPTR